MKRMTIIALCLILVLSLCPLTAFADVIYMPNDNFYNSHMNDCEYTNRGYTCYGPEGEVTVYKSPESSKVIHTLPNSEQICILYIYTDKENIQWGYWEDFRNNLAGWIPMNYLVLIYDSISFREDFGSEFKKQEGQIGTNFAGKEIRFWSYPGSDDFIAVTLGEDYTPEYWETYTDSTGLVWAYIGYYMGIRDRWICLEDPTADFDTLYPGEAPIIPTEEPVVGPPLVTVPKKTLKDEIFIGAAVLVVVIATALILKKKKKS